MIELASVSKVYRSGSIEVHALDHVDLSIAEGEFVAIMGASGSGKTTLMNVLGCMDLPTSGVYRLDGTDIRSLTENQLAGIRNSRIGFVFQSFNLVPRTNAQANVELPLIYAGAHHRRRRARTALERVGLGERWHHLPNQLSGGEQQRVAIARALVTDPRMILADEPTGNLDSFATTEVMDLFCELNHEGHTIVMITHERSVAALARRVIRLEDGRIVNDNPASGALVG
ncbi:putative ABC transport system ATP-binding protein [Pseudonocardia hierapolitana]|uniref:Putative ABC transport system ATP-binding protein n=1 Tax=Pseudonocardia hierapolitana TaxID=1128676 RepID=A0A561SX70_9PSEU|nr:ABC transporter ATP-binding protein [Pseudonocardia hierapolitana]TWF79462.1 putative ABC transport system ATP-binding protein [Pseudonocardia hierapolitana]